jgi:hypothetical protein
VDVSDLIPLAERAYPDARDRTAYPQDWIRSPVDNQYYPAARYGWFVAACQPAGDNVNDYLLIIVPYRKFLPTDRPGAEIQFQSANVAGTPPVVNLPYLNSPVVATMPPPPAWSGTFTFVTGITGVNGSLANTAFPAGAALVVGSSVAGRTVSPAIGCYPVRLGLRP